MGKRKGQENGVHGETVVNVDRRLAAVETCSAAILRPLVMASVAVLAVSPYPLVGTGRKKGIRVSTRLLYTCADSIGFFTVELMNVLLRSSQISSFNDILRTYIHGNIR